MFDFARLSSFCTCLGHARRTPFSKCGGVIFCCFWLVGVYGILFNFLWFGMPSLISPLRCWLGLVLLCLAAQRLKVIPVCRSFVPPFAVGLRGMSLYLGFPFSFIDSFDLGACNSFCLSFAFSRESGGSVFLLEPREIPRDELRKFCGSVDGRAFSRAGFSVGAR